MKRCPQCGKQYASDANFCPVDAGRLEDVPDNAPAEPDDHVLGGRFTVGELLGGGLTGQVFRASDKQTGHPCVVKWVDAAVFSSPLQMQRTERELKQLERSSAPVIARVLGHGRKGDRLWIASEYVAGVALDQLLEEVGALPIERASRLIHSVGVALAEAAKLGVIHRDVAPKNVLVGDGDEVHVINFGVAVPATPSVRGVPEYVAPEQVDGKPVDQRSNIYSLGAMLFTLVTGKPPFEGDPQTVHSAHLHANPPPASERADGIPPEVDKLLERALAKQSSKRFMTLRQLLGELEKLTGDEPSSTARFGSAAPERKRDSPAAQTMLGVGALSAETGEPNGRPVSSERGRGAPAAGPARSFAVSSHGAAAAAASGEIGGTPAEVVLEAGGGAAVHDRDNADTIPVERPENGASEAVPEPEPPGKAEPRARRPSASRKRKKKKKGNKFRETLWFKKGELDEADEEGKSGGGAGDLEVEDRYRDDGSVTTADRERLSLRTGDTSAMAAIRGGPDAGDSVTEKDLLDELTAARRRVIMVAGAVAVVVVIVLILILS
jgi:hypothetical protein